MNNQSGVSFGSGTSLLGAPASSVMGMPPGTLQSSPSSAGYQPGVLPNAPLQNNPNNLPTPPQVQSIGAPGPVSQPLTTPLQPQPSMPQPQQPQGVVGTPPQVPETMMILKALIARQQLLGKHEERVRDHILPPQGVV